jgi:hypothetical protein
MPQANVYTSATNQVIYTDKVRIASGTSPVTYQVNVIYPSASGNLYSNPPSVPANTYLDVFVGVKNTLTVSGTCTITELGTTTSGSYAVRDTGGTLPY